MALAMPWPTIAKSWTCSLPSAIIARWRLPAAYSHRMPSAICVRHARCRNLFHDLPEAIANTMELSARLSYEMRDLGYRFPSYPVPEGDTMQSFLEKRVEEGIRERYLPKDNLRSSLRKPSSKRSGNWHLIGQLELAGYFLIVWDIVQFCKREGILVQGRGSAANSVVCYALGITAIDPVGMELLFERFLTAERGEWPDIDLDLPSGDRRETRHSIRV